MLKRAQELQGQLIEWRRAIHQHPELGFQEVRTAALVADTLRSLGLRVEAGVGVTGVVGHLGQGPPVIALRADMDALPIQEENEVVYASQVPGVMHACGHDAHTAVLLGVAHLLHDLELPPGEVRFIFQPAEEVQDEEGKSGAMRMVEEGAMTDVDLALALHVDPDVPTGTIAISEGPIAAAVDTFYATIMGRGCHGAYPHKGVDPIYLLGQVINAIHGIIPRRVDPMQPAVISIGSVHGGQADNIIPAEVRLSGTIRSADEEVRVQLWAELERALGVARALGGDFELRIKKGYPATVNHPQAAELIRQVAVDLLGEEKIEPIVMEMGAEDFGILAAGTVGAMFGLGVKSDQEARLAHSSTFDLDEAALPVGAAILAEAARRFLAARS